MLRFKFQLSLEHLHEMADVLAVREYLGEVLGAEDSAQRGLGEQTGRPGRVLDVAHRYRGVRHSVVDHRIHRHRHRVLRQNLSHSVHTMSTL